MRFNKLSELRRNLKIKERKSKYVYKEIMKMEKIEIDLIQKLQEIQLN